MPKIYLDYAATTPVDPQALKAMLPYLKDKFGNPSSVHSFGREALYAMDNSRGIIANFLGCAPHEIIFTGSATEADNLAVVGIAKAFQGKPHIITTQIEHEAVLEPCRNLEKTDKAEVTYLPVDSDGRVSLSNLERAIKENTALVSVMYANNEIGTIQPIIEIGKLLQAANLKRQTKIYFHTDAVQAVNYLDCNVDKLGVDLMTLSSHKIYGPKGMGALYLKKGTPLEPIFLGGGQEFQKRSGTENMPGIIGFGKAVETGADPKTGIKAIKTRQMRDRVIRHVLKNIAGTKLNGSQENRLPNNINLFFNGISGSELVIALDQKGIAVSAGSACTARSVEPSHVLSALGLSEKDASSCIRITLGRFTKDAEIDKLLKVLPKVVEGLRGPKPR